MTETFLAQRITIGGDRQPLQQESGVPEIDKARLLLSIARQVFPSDSRDQRQFLGRTLPSIGLSRILGSDMMMSARKFYVDTGEADALVEVNSGISAAGMFTGISVIVPQGDVLRSNNSAEVLIKLGEVKDFVWDAALRSVYLPERAFVESSSIYSGGVHIPLSTLVPEGTYFL